MLACADATLTQRLTSAVCDSAWAPLCELVMNAVVVADSCVVGYKEVGRKQGWKKLPGFGSHISTSPKLTHYPQNFAFVAPPNLNVQ